MHLPGLVLLHGSQPPSHPPASQVGLHPRRSSSSRMWSVAAYGFSSPADGLVALSLAKQTAGEPTVATSFAFAPLPKGLNAEFSISTLSRAMRRSSALFEAAQS